MPVAVGEPSARHSAVTASASSEDDERKEWRRRESNPRPKMRPNEYLRV
jgi:hypothetical protein